MKNTMIMSSTLNKIDVKPAILINQQGVNTVESVMFV